MGLGIDYWEYHDGLKSAKDRREKWLLNVHVNPTNVELAKLCRIVGEDGLRGLVVGPDLYWWNSWYATHSDAAGWMKIDRRDWRDACIEAHVCEDGFIGVFAPDQTILDSLVEHPTLKGKIDPEGNLIET